MKHMYSDLFSSTNQRSKPHSNRYKRLRRIARAIAIEDDVLMARKVQVTRNGQTVTKLQPFWKYGCPRRLYQDMKKYGWGGTMENLQRLTNEVLAQ